MNKNPNPQGKGLVPLLDSISASRTQLSVPAKQIEQISSELFTSLFVLHSKFQFKPVVGKSYWLYRKQNAFQLSLISPQEWGGTKPGQYVGECVLQNDVTWTLNLDDNARQDRELLGIIEQQRRQFDEKLRSAQSIDSVLPVFIGTLPFYPRLFASALAHSLGKSMVKAGISGLSYKQAKGLLTDGSNT